MVKTKVYSIYIILTSVVLLLLFLSMLNPMVTSSNDFSIYNSGWNGCSRLARRTYESGKLIPNLRLDTGEELGVVQSDLASYDLLPESSALVILGPEITFDDEDIAYIHRFLEQGGKLLLGDDFGSGNSLLRGLEQTDSLFQPYPVLDLSFDKNPQFGVAYDIKGHEITRGVAHLLLNKPAAIRPGEGADALVYSSRASWLDENLDGQMDLTEPRGPFPLLTVESYGNGTLILLSDPSILINSMLDQRNNDILARNLFSFLVRGRTSILFSESHQDISTAYSLIYYLSYPPGAISMAAISLAVITTLFVVVPGCKETVVITVRKLLKREGVSKEDPIRKLLNKHTDWDEHKIRMIYSRFPEGKDQRVDDVEKHC